MGGIGGRARVAGEVSICTGGWWVPAEPLGRRQSPGWRAVRFRLGIQTQSRLSNGGGISRKRLSYTNPGCLTSERGFTRKIVSLANV